MDESKFDSIGRELHIFRNDYIELFPNSPQEVKRWGLPNNYDILLCWESIPAEEKISNTLSWNPRHPYSWKNNSLLLPCKKTKFWGHNSIPQQVRRGMMRSFFQNCIVSFNSKAAQVIPFPNQYLQVGLQFLFYWLNQKSTELPLVPNHRKTSQSLGPSPKIPLGDPNVSCFGPFGAC